MLGGRIVGSLRLHQRGLGGVQVAAGNRALGEQLLAAFYDALVQIEIGLGLREVRLRLVRVFRHLRLGCGGVRRLRRLERSFVVHRRGRQVGVIQRDEQLAGMHPLSALDIELAHGRADSGRDCGLGDRRQNGVSGNLLGDRPLHRMLGLHGDLHRRRGSILAAGQKHNWQRHGGRKHPARRCTRHVLRVVLCFVVLLLAGSHCSRDRLQYSPRGLIAHAPILARVFRAHVGIFRVHNFEHRGLAAGVAQFGEAQALGRVDTLWSSDAS